MEESFERSEALGSHCNAKLATGYCWRNGDPKFPKWNATVVKVLRCIFHQRGYRFFNASSSSSVRGQSDFSSRDKLRSASTFPPVWQRAQ